MHLLLIGGGEIGAQRSDGTYRPLETLDIDYYFLNLIGKTNPKILFVPTAIEQKDIFLGKSLIQNKPFIAIDNCCALDITNEAIKIISSKEQASAYYYDICNSKNAIPLTKQEIGLINA